MIYKLRFQWYWNSVKMYFKRNQQTILITLACALPIASEADFLYNIVHLISTPVLSVLEANSGFQRSAVTLLFLLMMFIGVTQLQRSAILGEPLTEFIKTLPIPRVKQLLIHCKIILIANNIAWLFVISPLFMYPYSDKDYPSIVLFIVEVLLVTVLIVYVQLTFLLRPALLFFLLPVAISVFISVSSINVITFEISVALFFMASLVALMVFSLTPGRVMAWRIGLFSGSLNQLRFNLSSMPLLVIYLKMLLRESRYTTIIFLGCYASITYIALYFMSKNGGLPYFQIYLVILSYLLSNFYTVFSGARKDIEQMFKTLPVRKHFFILWDVAFLSALIILLSAPLGMYFSGKGKFDFSVYLILLFGTTPMLFLLYFVRNRMSKNGATAGIALCILWILMFIQVEG